MSKFNGMLYAQSIYTHTYTHTHTHYILYKYIQSQRILCAILHSNYVETLLWSQQSTNDIYL